MVLLFGLVPQAIFQKSHHVKPQKPRGVLVWGEVRMRYFVCSDWLQLHVDSPSISHPRSTVSFARTDQDALMTTVGVGVAYEAFMGLYMLNSTHYHHLFHNIH